jgi:hypothetical protein
MLKERPGRESGSSMVRDRVRQRRRVTALAFVVAVILPGSFGGMALHAQEPASAAEFIRGDANTDGKVTLADVFSILGYLHRGGKLDCFDAADVDDDGRISTADWLSLLVLVNRIGTPLVAPVGGLRGPYPQRGLDPTTDDQLDCERGRAPPRARAAPANGGGAGGRVQVMGPCDPIGFGSELEFIHFSPDEIWVYPGEELVRTMVVFESVNGGAQALTMSLFSAPEFVRLESLRFSDRFLAENATSASSHRIFDDARDEGFLAASLAIDLNTGAWTIPETTQRTMAELTFSVTENARVGEDLLIEFRPFPAKDGLPEIPNEVIHEGLSEEHERCGVLLHVVERQSIFIRGDGDHNGSIDLSDAVAILRYLFDGERSAPRCLDAADVNDNGSIDISDVTFLTNYLFLQGSPPLPPFPNAGPDSTELTDELDCH